MGIASKAGTAVFKDLDGYLLWYAGLSLENAKAFYKKLSEAREGIRCQESALSRATDMLKVRSWSNWSPADTEEAKWPVQRDTFLTDLQEFAHMAEQYNMPTRVGEWHEGLFAYIYLGNPDKGIIVPEPEKYLEYAPEKEYGDMTPAQVRQALCMPASETQMGIVPADVESSMTQNSVAEQKRQCEDMIQNIAKEIDDVRYARNGELAELQQKIAVLEKELQAKKDNLMQELRERMEEMEQMKENLENQIYLLDSQIYAIRCFAGEVVKFAQIRAGQKAPDTEPIVIHQKLHFLDEDLGRLASLYEIHWSEISLF